MFAPAQANLLLAPSVSGNHLLQGMPACKARSVARAVHGEAINSDALLRDMYSYDFTPHGVVGRPVACTNKICTHIKMSATARWQAGHVVAVLHEHIDIACSCHGIDSSWLSAQAEDGQAHRRT